VSQLESDAVAFKQSIEIRDEQLSASGASLQSTSTGLEKAKSALAIALSTIQDRETRIQTLEREVDRCASEARKHKSDCESNSAALVAAVERLASQQIAMGEQQSTHEMHMQQQSDRFRTETDRLGAALASATGTSHSMSSELSRLRAELESVECDRQLLRERLALLQ
jgi:chromosome segregation ATPase